jgi:hypothetical protein
MESVFTRSSFDLSSNILRLKQGSKSSLEGLGIGLDLNITVATLWKSEREKAEGTTHHFSDIIFK